MASGAKKISDNGTHRSTLGSLLRNEALTMKNVAAVVAVALIIFPALAFITEGTDAADNSVSTYWDGSTYEYKTYGAGTEGSPYEATIVRLTSGGQDPLRIKSMLEGYPLTAIGSNAFVGSGIRSAIVPESVTAVGDGALSVPSLTDVYFLGPKPSIGTGALGNGTTLHYTEEYADSWKGTNAELFPIYTYADANGQAQFSYYVLKGEATVHKHIGGSTIMIPDSVSAEGKTVPVTSIGPHSFRNDASIISVTLGNNIIEIGERAFYHSSNFKNIVFSPSLVAINDEAFREASSLNPGDAGTVIIPPTVKYLGFESFRMCHALTRMTIPSTVEFFGDGVLRASFGLKEVVFENKIIEISPYFLDNCYALTDVTLPAGVETIGSNAFTGDRALERINIPDTVISIGSSAFNACTSLRSIDLVSTKTLGNNAFMGCTALETVNLGDSLRSIGSSAFRGCISLKEVSAPHSVDAIGSEAFRGCVKLAVIRLSSVSEIGDGAFRNTGVISVELSGSLETIRSDTFRDCPSLTWVDLGKVKTIEAGAFQGDASLKQIDIPGTVETIGDRAFAGCSDLKTVNYLGNIPQISESAFESVQKDDGSDSMSIIWLVVAVLVTAMVAATVVVLMRRRNIGS
ncbi:MAG: leucine-rich repeat domain-containing protein [Candidatus Methanoplasma sp.]|jgi:hypothetical protein|nr:leucine-rich repeat domain-containing protein [Candidatus Methanoplasma sp.]